MDAARVATADDLPELVTLCRLGLAELGAQERGGGVFVAREARAEPVDASLAQALTDPAAIVVVGTFNDLVVGYGTGRSELLRDGRRLGVVDDVFVEIGARGIGVGEAVMAHLLGWFRQQGCDGVDSTALPGLRSTKNFFETAGFTARLIVMHHRLAE
ncbi:MAG: GNAT family N-acetyltransferase [Acidimicrobiales bacterium]